MQKLYMDEEGCFWEPWTNPRSPEPLAGFRRKAEKILVIIPCQLNISKFQASQQFPANTSALPLMTPGFPRALAHTPCPWP